MAISGRPILDDFDDPVQALTDGIGQGSVDEGQDVDEVSTQCADERAQCGNATAQGSGHPGPEKLLCRGPIAVCPEVLKLVLEHPGAVDAAIGVPQAPERETALARAIVSEGVGAGHGNSRRATAGSTPQAALTRTGNG